MLHLAVFVEGIHQIRQGLRLGLDGPQIPLRLLRGDLPVTDGADVAGDDGDRGLEIVRDVRDALLTALIQPPPLCLTFCQAL